MSYNIWDLEESGAFKNCTGITSVTIPNNITRIGHYVFANCVGLKEITLPSELNSIGNHAFYKCAGIKKLIIPDNVTNIDSNAFEECNGIKEITFSKNLVSIGNSAFLNCSGLTSLTLPDSVTTIGERSFEGCSGIKNLTLSKNISKIPFRAFDNCNGLTSVVLPDSITTIENYAMGKKLTKILIPDSVASISNYAFLSNTNLTIYGNDGMASKEYAETNKINFDYIANWNKQSTGADVTAPTVESIKITYESVKNYTKDTNKKMYMVPAGAKLVINVDFSEIVDGTTVPTLTVKYGNGENIKLTEGTVAGSSITYSYTVQSKDKGVMATVSLEGGNIKDAAGNAATLSCPALSIQYRSEDFVYANGSTSSSDNSNNNSSNNNTTNDNKNNNTNTANDNKNNNTNTSNGNKTSNDNTTAKTPIPQTGANYFIVIAILVVVAISVYLNKKRKEYKDIK